MPRRPAWIRRKYRKQMRHKKQKPSDGIIRHRWVKEGLAHENSSQDYCNWCGIVRITTALRHSGTLHVVKYYLRGGADELTLLGSKRPQCVRPSPEG